MKLENTATFRICAGWNEPDTYTWHDFFKAMNPNASLRYAWIPQTLGEQVWIFWEFSNPQEKQDFIDSIPRKFKNFQLSENFDQDDLNHYTGELSECTCSRGYHR